jgi:CBS domain-containing protein
MKAKEIMSEPVACCTPETPLPEVARTMVEHDCGAVPIVESITGAGGGRKIVGIVTDRDIACRAVAQGKDARTLTARDAMSPGVVTVGPDASLEECCKTMEEHQVRRVPVADGAGLCCGVVSQADIARAAPERHTAEVVKELSRAGDGPRRC